MMHIILGLFFVAFGIWGIFDEWYYVLDCLKGGGSLALVLGGFVAMLAGALGQKSRQVEGTDEEPERGISDSHN
jgi:hypothetical protein